MQKLKQYARNVVVSGTDEEEVGATFNPAALGMFSDSTYQHKILAVVRETLCNAYDSHIQAGKESTPTLVTLPSELNPEFSVEDFGVGLDDDEVLHVFLWFFASTKGDDIRQTGACGIGAKSPFSYTKSFHIRARKDGMERVYVAFINERGMPARKKISASQTTEPNGVKVSLAVKPEDFKAFSQAASSVISGFRVKPTIKGQPEFQANIPNLYERFGDQPYVILNGNPFAHSLYSRNRLLVLMGNVFYPVDDSMIVSNYHDSDPLEKFARSILNYRTLIIRAEIGELSHSPSREHLSLDKDTTNRLKELVLDSVRGIRSRISEKILQAPTRREAHRVLLEEFGGNYSNLGGFFQWGGKYLSQPFFNLKDFKTETNVKDISIFYWHRERMREHLSASYFSQDKVHVLDSRDEVTDGMFRKFKTYLKYITTNPNREDYVVTVEGGMTPYKKHTINEWFGEERIVWHSWETVEDVVKEHRRLARQEKQYDRGTATSNTIYSVSVDETGRYPVQHVELKDENVYVWIPRAVDISSTFIQYLNFLVGQKVVVLFQNDNNMKKMKKNGIRHLSALTDDLLVEYFDEILLQRYHELRTTHFRFLNTVRSLMDHSLLHGPTLRKFWDEIGRIKSPTDSINSIAVRIPDHEIRLLLTKRKELKKLQEFEEYLQWDHYFDSLRNDYGWCHNDREIEIRAMDAYTVALNESPEFWATDSEEE